MLEASKECILLRSLIHRIRSTCNLISITDIPTIIFEDNAVCIDKFKEDLSKEIELYTSHQSKFFYTNEHQKSKKINVK